ncbi:TPA: hypothetical protein I0H99_RS05080 [Enterococcus faecium]
MDPNKQDQGALEAQKIKLYYNEVGEEKLDQYIETLAYSLIKFIRNFEDSEYVSERLKKFSENFSENIYTYNRKWPLWNDLYKATRSSEALHLETIFRDAGFNKLSFGSQDLSVIYKQAEELLNEKKEELIVEILKGNPNVELYISYDPKAEQGKLLNKKLKNGEYKTKEERIEALADGYEHRDEKAKDIEKDIIQGVDETEIGAMIRLIYPLEKTVRDRVNFYKNDHIILAPWARNKELTDLWSGVIPPSEEKFVGLKESLIHKSEQEKILLTYGNGKEFNATFHDLEEKNYKWESCEKYIEIIAEMLEEKNGIQGKLNQDVFENFDQYIPSTKRQGQLWGEFQRVSRKFEEFHLENIVGWDEFMKKAYPEQGFKHSLNQWFGKMSVELAKENPKIELGVFYDPAWESVKSLEFYTPISKTKWKKRVESTENAIAQKLHLAETSDTLHHLYHNESSLGGRIYYYDRKNVLTNVAPWAKSKELGTVWSRSSREETLTFLLPQMDGQSDLSASIKPQEHRKISLFVSETGKYADEDNFRQKNPTKAEHTIESIDDYISATIGAIFKNQRKFYDPDFRQHFYENFTKYIPSDKKHWELWDDFQKVSRSFEEFKLENIYIKLDINFEIPMTWSKELTLISYLHKIKGEIAVEIVKRNPMTELTLFYDPIQIYAAYDVVGWTNSDYSDYYDSDTSNSSDSSRRSIDIDQYADKIERRGTDRAGILDIEEKFAKGTERENEKCIGRILRYAFHNKSELEGRIVLFDRHKQIADRLPWEKEEIAEAWRNACKSVVLTPSINNENKLHEKKESETSLHQSIDTQVKHRKSPEQLIKKQPQQLSSLLKTVGIRNEQPSKSTDQLISASTSQVGQQRMAQIRQQEERETSANKKLCVREIIRFYER